MEHSEANATHFHIHWSGKETLDWEPFNTREEAERRAAEIVQRDEEYTVEEHGQDCPQCNEWFEQKLAMLSR
jgi:hypothetical protein